MTPTTSATTAPVSAITPSMICRGTFGSNTIIMITNTTSVMPRMICSITQRARNGGHPQRDAGILLHAPTQHEHPAHLAEARDQGGVEQEADEDRRHDLPVA